MPPQPPPHPPASLAPQALLHGRYIRRAHTGDSQVAVICSQEPHLLKLCIRSPALIRLSQLLENPWGTQAGVRWGFTQTLASRPSPQGSEMTPSPVAVLLVHQGPPPRNPQQSLGHGGCAQTRCVPRPSPGTRRGPCPPNQDSHLHTSSYLARRGAAPDLLPL